jgi:hypothetical protein
MRETRSSGSVEGVVRDHDLYSDYADVPAEWRAFLKSQQAQAIYPKYGFRSI